MTQSIATVCENLRAETQALRALVTSGAIHPETPTAFMGWIARNSIDHVVMVDRLATLAITDPAAAAAERALFGQHSAPPDAAPPERFGVMAAYETMRLGLLSWEQLLAAWEIGLDQLIAAALAAGDEARVEWFAGSMRLISLLEARQMEVWAYGQDVFDAAGVSRAEAARLRTVVEFAMKVRGFSFTNRGEPVPPVKPYVTLVAPDGSQWEWNDPASPEQISGSARDFCLVATQRRHVDDTGLAVIGAGARRWMEVSQCIAGSPMDGPPPRARS
jgi:uncharacterized protein (TIGR03084 family)